MATAGTLNFDEDVIADKRLVTRKWNDPALGGEVHASGVVLVDREGQAFAIVEADGSLRVSGTLDVVTKGATIRDSTPVFSGTTRVQLVVADNARRALWITNSSAVTVWVGASTCDVNRGIRLDPGGVLNIDKAPRAAWWAKPVASLGGNLVSILEELD